MQVLTHAKFNQQTVPAGWNIDSTVAMTPAGLVCDRTTNLDTVLPGLGWNQLKVEVTIDRPAGSTVGVWTCFHPTYLGTRMEPTSCRSQLMVDQTVHFDRRADKAFAGGRQVVRLEYDCARRRVLVDGEQVFGVHDTDLRPQSGRLHVQVGRGVTLVEIRVLGGMPTPHPLFEAPARRHKDFHLEVNVDFPDDLMHAPFTRQMFDDYFAEFARWGVKRCHWIHYGRMDEGFWEFSEMGAGINGFRTVENIGSEIFPVAVEAAHAHDIEIYGMFKPFDMGFWNSFAPGKPEAKKFGRIDRVGGPIGWVTHFVAKHRELMMARKPGAFGEAKTKTVNRIDIVKDDERAAAINVQDLTIWVSDDNTTYRQYEGPMTRTEVVENYPLWEHTSSGGRPSGETRKSRVLRLTDLQITQRYFAIATSGRSASFVNTLINFIHVFGEHGEERMLTYGTVPRFPQDEPEGAGTKRMYDINKAERVFTQLGFEFDRLDGTPSSLFPGFDAIRAPYYFDHGEGLLAVAMAKDRTTIATLSPSYPEARQWWLTWIQQCLDAGADGIEVRDRNHHSPYAWLEFGYEQPVRDEYLRRYGVDIWQTDDFDTGAWRRLRGEAYTEFYREASRLTRRHGKRFGIHMDGGHHLDPALGGPMQLHMDWRTWLTESLCDSVTMKEIPPRTRMADEIVSLARPRGIEVICCRFANGFWRGAGGAPIIARRIKAAREAGFDGFQFYEAASVVRATKDGRIVMEHPDLAEVFRAEFGRTAVTV